MTNREAKEYILQNWFDGAEDVKANIPIDKEYKAMKLAVEALEGCEWHYPSKGDYPPNEDVLVAVRKFGWHGEPYTKIKVDTMTCLGKFFNGGDGDYSLDDFIAWMPLPLPPKERA